MGKNNRREVAKRLTQEISVTTDTATLLELSKQLTKVLPKRRRTRKPLEEEPKKKTTPEDTFVKKDYPHGGDFLEKLPMGRREFWRIILGVEAAPGVSTMTREERLSLIAKMIEGFSNTERAAFEAYEPPDVFKS